MQNRAAEKSRPKKAPAVPCLMASGRLVDLAALAPADIHWPDLVESLVKLPSFNGSTRGVSYTVAQHCCLAYDYADQVHKPAALLRDFYKAFLGEVSSPALSLMASLSPDGSAALAQAWHNAKHHLSAAIFAAARIPVPTSDPDLAYLRILDLKILATERRDFQINCPSSDRLWKLPPPFPKLIKAWGQDKALGELTKRMNSIGLEGRL